jgi:HK97 family phage major capsid protein
MIPGRSAVRAVKALAVARGNIEGAVAYARSQAWLDEAQVVRALNAKASVPSMGTDNFPLPTPDAYDFAEALRPSMIIGKLAGARRAPLRVRVIAATAGSTAFWVGERQPKPVSKMDFTGTIMEPAALAAVVVTTLELLRSSNPSAETILQRDLGAAAILAADSAFIDPENAGVPDVKPPAISVGATPIVCTGNSADKIDADLAAVTSQLLAVGSSLAFAQWVLNPRTAVYLAQLRDSTGVRAYPDVRVNGGILAGLPVIVSAGVPIVSGKTSITLIDGDGVIVGDDGGGEFSISEQGGLQMADAPVAGAVALVSLWQASLAALKVVRYVNWQTTRPGLAQPLVDVTY